MSELVAWLERHGLGRYADVFAANDVDLQVLPELTDDDLKELGLSLGHRRALQRAVRAEIGDVAPDTDSLAPESPPHPLTGEAERRQLTVMFCDLVGSVALGERMDVEDYRDLLGRYRRALVTAVERYDGFVARHQGDGVLVYFGYPRAHEDDPERAVRAGLGILEAAIGSDSLRSGLDRLVASELVYRSTVSDRFAFKHALVRDAAYEGLLRSDRVRLHGLVAGALASRFPERAAAEPELVAHRHTEAGQSQEAVRWWLLAGQRAAERSAHLEATTQLRRGLEALEWLEESPERDRLELPLQAGLGAALVAGKGYPHPEVGATYSRARALAESIGDEDALAIVLRGQHTHEAVRGRLARALATAEELARIVRGSVRGELRVGAQHNLTQIHYWLGDPKEALRQGEEGIRLYDPERHDFSDWPGGHCGVQCHLWAALAAGSLGRYRLARTYLERALALNASLSTLPFRRVHAVALACILPTMYREVAAARTLCDEATALCAEHDIPYWREFVEIFRAWGAAMEGDVDHRVRNAQHACEVYLAPGAKLFSPLFLSLLAEICLQAGHVDGGLEATDAALKLAGETGERWWVPETHRLRGELLLARDPAALPEAERCYRDALEAARVCDGLTLELRAASSLARLWADRNRRSEARVLLAPLCERFADDEVGSDLEEARVLLNALA